MWTNENRARYDRSHLRYPSDLSDDEWKLVEPLIPPGKRGGDKRTVIMREVVNGLMYILSTGCQWRAIPKDLPPRSTLYDYFDLWSWDGTLDLIHYELYVKCREAIGREASPTAAVIDSQSVKSAEKASKALKKMLWGKRRDSCKIVASINLQLTELRMQKPHDNSKASPAAFVQDNTLIAVIELGLSNWLVAGLIPGVSREPLKKLEPNPEDLLKLLHGWRDEAIKAGRPITRIAVAYETGRDSFWLARWLRERGIDAHVIHATSVAVSREHRRAKTDRLDTAMLKRGFLGWLRGERGHCTVAIVPTMEEEDAKRPYREREGLVHEQTRVVNRMKSALIQFGVRNFNPKLRQARVRLETVRTPEGKSLPPNTIAALRRDMERLKIIKEQIKAIEQARLQQFEQKPEALANRMVYLLVRIYGLGWETADLLVHELLSRTLRDRKAVARYAGLTGSPDESGSKRREKGLSRSGNARVRKIMIQLAWRMVKFQPDSALVQWFKQRTENAKGSRKPMIVALARKLIIALWRYANDGVIPEGFRLHSAA